MYLPFLVSVGGICGGWLLYAFSVRTIYALILYRELGRGYEVTGNPLHDTFCEDLGARTAKKVFDDHSLVACGWQTLHRGEQEYRIIDILGCGTFGGGRVNLVDLVGERRLENHPSASLYSFKDSRIRSSSKVRIFSGSR
jgi:hypothetical protein